LSTKPKAARPLSPHLQIYRWQYTMTLSILNRITGVVLSVGLLLFVYWLVALASGVEAYARAEEVFAHALTRVALIGFSLAFFYHLSNGVRHLVWDAGRGLERQSARTSGWVAVIAAVIMTVVMWVVVITRFGGSGA
jgi:succinate dehydrogenase / fumarate reductase cytochrome b subunit